jgi:formylglycine-generating enzyme required for sulfatase activity
MYGSAHCQPHSFLSVPLFLFLPLLTLIPAGCDRWPAAVTNEPTKSPVSRSDVRLVSLTNVVLIKAGTFQRQQHTVTLTRDFWLGKYEVTQAEFAALMGSNPSHFQTNENAKVGSNLPVEKVRHIDAVAYCAALTERERQAGRLPATFVYRLPTEAEWEYACRAGSTNLFSFGDMETEAGLYAWTAENSEGRTHPVGLKRPNAWGLYDMHGNVWEWCLDWFGNYPAINVTDPKGPPQGKGKVFKGGGWNHEAPFARSGSRFVMAPSSGIHFVGFRVALSEAP